MKAYLIGKLFFAAVLCVALTACSSTPSTINPEGTNDANANSKDEEQEIHWSYSGDTGPENWSTLDTSFEICAEGKEQSPINLEKAKTSAAAEANINIDYQPGAFTVKNNGHTIQAEALTDDNTIEIDGDEYQLVQFHFHVPSEHQLEGKHLDMELHFVHKNADGQLAVLGVLMKAGEENDALAELWAQMPKEETQAAVELTDPVDLTSLLPQNKAGFHYNGSLTTPPCSEGVKWVVLAEPITVSQEQIDVFAAIFPDNHRPVQPWNDRDIYEAIAE
ncbi:carbonic anhydrase [Evansella caseinilytica]|uniref:carbonic anhydrase n=1 Tax=Evansella caseinilytica TaxID=1503961 RepID=A0A1H3Q5H3_9BACI|nr:carbonic anhydrase [Evansella caseinilytica]SDZ08431.1 carbonic anhydrase [Evansella caseinilytica]